jgi:hypothetical protein
MNIIQKLKSFKKTSRKNDYITLKYNDIVNILKLIDKPVETTNEQPLYDNLKEWFEDSLEEDKDYPNWKKIHTHIIRCSNNIVNFQFKGFELVLLPDGKYILGDTSGG